MSIDVDVVVVGGRLRPAKSDVNSPLPLRVFHAHATPQMTSEEEEEQEEEEEEKEKGGTAHAADFLKSLCYVPQRPSLLLVVVVISRH